MAVPVTERAAEASRLGPVMDELAVDVQHESGVRWLRIRVDPSPHVTGR
jgi:hypothetical protein